MGMDYEPRKGSDRNVEEMLREAELHRGEDTTNAERLHLISNLESAIERAKYKVYKCLNYFG
jgi:hypothetical protein